MQVPNSPVGRTSNSFTPLQAPQENVPAGAFGGQIGQALTSAGGALEDFGVTALTQARARDDATTKFQTLQSFDDFSTKADQSLQDLKRGVDPTGKGYVADAMSTFNQQADGYLAQVPEKLRPEFQYRVNDLRNNILKQSTDFQYKAGDLYFRQGISDGLDAAKKAVYTTPAALESQRVAVQEKINTSDLSSIDKQDLIRKSNAALEATAYGRTYVQNKMDEATGVNSPRNYGPKSEIEAPGQHIYNLTPGAKGILAGIASAGIVPTVKVSSGTREGGENAARGGVTHSQHIPDASGLGNAVDIDTTNMSDAQKAGILRAAIESGAKGVGIYASGNHFHFDARDTPSVWGQKGTKAERIEEQPVWARPALAEMFGGQVPQRNAPAAGTNADGADLSTYLKSLGGKEASGNIYAQNPDSSAGGLYQITDGTFRQIRKGHPELGLTDKMDPHQQELAVRALTADNDKYLGDRNIPITNKNRYMAHFLGAQGAVSFIKAMQANPDQLPGPAFADAKASNRNVFFKIEGGHYVPRTMGEIYAFQTQKFGGGTNRAQSELDNNPAFSSVPLEDRISMQRDGDAEVQRTLLQHSQDIARTQQATVNSLMNGVLDGVIGRSDVDSAYHGGQLTDAGDREKLYSAIDKRDKEAGSAQEGLAAIASGQPQDMSDDKWKKSFNAVFGKDAQAKIRGGDGGFVSQGLVPAVQRAQDIPTDTAGLLAAMARGGMRASNKFAYDTMEVLAQAAPDAYAKRFDDQTRSMARAYSAAKRDGTADLFLDRVNGPGAEEWRRQLPQMQEEAKQFLDGKTLDKSIPNSETLFNQVIGSYTSGIYGFRTVAHAPAYPLAQMAMQQEFRDEFTQEYSLYRDPAKASAAAVANIEKRWGASDIGGVRTVMKDPPEKVGYTAFQTGPGATADYGWIDRQVRSELGLSKDAKYELVSDDQTARERNAFGQGGPAPSYQIVTYDANGVPNVVLASNGGGNRRINFAVPQSEKDEAFRALTERGATQDAMKKIALEDELKLHARMSGTEVPPEVTQDAAVAKQKLDAVMAPETRKAMTLDDAINKGQANDEDIFNWKFDHPKEPVPDTLVQTKALLDAIIFDRKKSASENQ